MGSIPVGDSDVSLSHAHDMLNFHRYVVETTSGPDYVIQYKI